LFKNANYTVKFHFQYKSDSETHFEFQINSKSDMMALNAAFAKLYELLFSVEDFDFFIYEHMKAN